MEPTIWADVRNAFEEAARWFVRTVPAARGHWDEPGLGEWTVRDLVGHTSRSLLTVEAYLDEPAAGVEVASAAEYFSRVFAAGGDPAAVARRGRDAGAALGDDPAAAVAEIAERVLRRVGTTAGDAPAGTPVGGMRLRDYLRTRTFELTVHTCDLAIALGLPIQVPDGPARDGLALMAELAADAGRAGPLLLAATGRGALPDGFSVLEP